MKKTIGLLVISLASMVASAGTINTTAFETFRAVALAGDVQAQGLNFKVGDQATYNLNMSIIKGSMIMTVREVTADSAVINQEMNLGFAGKQSCDIAMNPNTGETKSIVCNGKQQAPADPSDVELVETKEDKITVPAGEFTCLYVKALLKKQNQTVEQWANMREVPVLGMVKTVAPSQLGKVTIELKSFKKN